VIRIEVERGDDHTFGEFYFAARLVAHRFGVR